MHLGMGDVLIELINLHLYFPTVCCKKRVNVLDSTDWFCLKMKVNLQFEQCWNLVFQH